MQPSRSSFVAIPLLALAVACTGGGGSGASSPNRSWPRQLGSNDSDVAFAAASDGSGGVYIGGRTRGSLGGSSAGTNDAWFARFDSNANLVWKRQIGTDAWDWALDAASDGAGGVYFAGLTNGDLGGSNPGESDAWFARYDSAGNQLWIRQIGTSDQDTAGVAAPDGSGGVYVGGSTTGSLGGPNSGGSDEWLARYDSNGSQLWIRQYSEVPDARAAALSALGGLFLCGGSPEAFVARFDDSGNQLWIRELATVVTVTGWAAAADDAGGVYVAGETVGSLGGPNLGMRDAWVARYDRAGNQLWIRQLGSAHNEELHGATTDGSGGVYLTGATRGALGATSNGDDDVWIARYDDTGELNWLRQIGSSAGDYAYAAAPGNVGGVYVCGATYGSFGGPNSGEEDAWVTRSDGLGPLYETGFEPSDSEGFVTSFCVGAVPNSTGQGAVLTVTGNSGAANNNLTLIASRFPPGEFGHFLVSRTTGFSWLPGSNCCICLGGDMGRYNRSHQIVQGPTGSLHLDLTAMPVNPPQAVQPGETWHFQFWFRDHDPRPTSNWTNGISAAFQ